MSRKWQICERERNPPLPPSFDFNIPDTVFQYGGDDLIPGTVGRIRNSVQLRQKLFPNPNRYYAVSVIVFSFDLNRFIFHNKHPSIYYSL